MAQFKVADDPNFPYCAGLLKRREDALNFVDYLLTLGIKAKAQEQFSGAWGIYAMTEDDAYRIKLELLRWGQSPFNKAYRQAAWQRGAQAPRRTRQMGSALTAFALEPLSVTTLIEVLCVILYLVSFFPQAYSIAYAYLGLYRAEDLAHFELWRLITPIFFHFGILHIAFNLVMWEAFARPLERALGRLKLLSLSVVVAMLSNALQFAFITQPAAFGGLSGVVYGVIGYLGVRSLSPACPAALRLPRGLLTVSVVFIAFGFFMSGIANFCHAGGLAVGALWGFIDNKRQES